MSHFHYCDECNDPEVECNGRCNEPQLCWVCSNHADGLCGGINKCPICECENEDRKG